VLQTSKHTKNCSRVAQSYGDLNEAFAPA
jgi:hypothetical protein